MGYLEWSFYQDGVRSGRIDAFPPHHENAMFPNKVNDPPEQYVLYRKCCMWGNWQPGGVGDQPHILLTEFAVCANAEARFNEQKLPQLREMEKK